MSVIPSILNGKPVLSRLTYPVLSNTSKHLHDYSPIDKAWIPQVCTDAMAGFSAWRRRPFSERSQILFAAANLIEEHLAEYTEAHKELGCIDAFASFGVSFAAASIREYALKVSDPEGLLLKSLETKMAFSVKTPIGPVLSIASWNAPLILTARAIAAPLAAGCSVILKSNEKAPRVASLLANHFLSAGVDPAALQLIHVGPQEHPQVTDEFLKNPDIRIVNFTGSTEVGRQVSQLAARNFKPALLELGGKNVSIVLKDADLAAAAAKTLLGGWLHMGQICMCLDTVYVHEEVYDEFKAHLQETAKAMLKEDGFVYPQRDQKGAQKVRSLVEDALGKGARLIGDEVEFSRFHNVKPCVLEGVTSDMQITSQETFGPVICLEKYGDVDALVEKINSSLYGLKASVWSKDILQAVDIAKRLESGGVHVNSSTIHDEATLPHGGVKASGTGRFNSTWGIEQFQYTKTITLS